MEKLVRLNQALGVNLKPNEDLDDAGAGAMLPMSPMEALRTGSYHQNVTVMIGSNENDGLILTTPLTTDPSLYILYRYTVAHQQLMVIFSLKVAVVSDSSGYPFSRPSRRIQPRDVTEGL